MVDPTLVLVLAGVLPEDVPLLELVPFTLLVVPVLEFKLLLLLDTATGGL